MEDAPFVDARILALFPPDFTTDERVLMRIEDGHPGMIPPAETPPARIYDARALQRAAKEQSDSSETEFFDEHGFVLLEHASQVVDWDVDTLAPDSPLSKVYFPEIESLVRRQLFPRRHLDVWQGPPIRRGPGTANPTYAGGVHQDFGLTPDDFQETMEAFTSPEIGRFWRDRFDRDDVAGMIAIDFWRPVGMSGPLRHMPLCVSDASTIRVEDVVPLGLVDFAPSGLPTNQSGLRYHPDQRWYYYPDMTPNEVLVFKQFEFWKDAPGPHSSCFHTAFELPGQRPDVEPRQSSEHRVMVFCCGPDSR